MRILDMSSIPQGHRVDWMCWFAFQSRQGWVPMVVWVGVGEGDQEAKHVLADEEAYGHLCFSRRELLQELRAQAAPLGAGELLWWVEGQPDPGRRRWADLGVEAAVMYRPEQWREYVEQHKAAELERARAAIEKRWEGEAARGLEEEVTACVS